MTTSGKRLVQSGNLPERSTSAERIAHMTEDVRDLTGQLRRNLTDFARTYSVFGWAMDEESWESAINGRAVVLSVVIRRDA